MFGDRDVLRLTLLEWLRLLAYFSADFGIVDDERSAGGHVALASQDVKKTTGCLDSSAESPLITKSVYRMEWERGSFCGPYVLKSSIICLEGGSFVASQDVSTRHPKSSSHT